MNRRTFFNRVLGAFITTKVAPSFTDLSAKLNSYVTAQECDNYVMGILRKSEPMTFKMAFPPPTALLESLNPLPVGSIVALDIDGRVKEVGVNDLPRGVVTGSGASVRDDGLTTYHATVRLD